MKKSITKQNISTQIEYIDIQDILKNYKKDTYWQKSWRVLKTHTFSFYFRLRSINVRRGLIESELFVPTTLIKRGNRKYAIREMTKWLYDIPINNSDYRQETFERNLTSNLEELIRWLEDEIIQNTSDYRMAKREEQDYYYRVEELAKEKLDEENVSNKDIRDAYIDSCRSNASVDYTSRVKEAKRLTIFPNLYLMLYSWFRKHDKFLQIKKEITDKKSRLKKTLISYKRELWAVEESLESEDINEEIIDLFEEI